MEDSSMTSTSTQFVIRNWLRAFATSTERNRDDLHVDQINSEFKNPRRWSEAGVQCLHLAFDAVQSENLPVTVAMEFFLAASQEPTGYSGGRVQDLRFSWTPPALTVFRPDAVPWRQSDAFTPVEADTGLPEGVVGRVLYQEWFDESEGDYDRRLWLVGG